MLRCVQRRSCPGLLPAGRLPGAQGRDHLDFVVRLRDVLPCRATLVDQLCGCLEAQGFSLQVRCAVLPGHAGRPACTAAPLSPQTVLHCAAVSQEASLAEAQAALAAGTLCGTLLHDVSQLLAAEGPVPPASAAAAG